MKLNQHMYKSPHPGKIIKRALLDETGFTITKAAKILDISRIILSKLISGKSNISAEMAVRLSIALNTSSQMWVNMQTMYDLWHAEKKRKKLKVKSIAHYKFSN